jgi:hypothetical protein
MTCLQAIKLRVSAIGCPSYLYCCSQLFHRRLCWHSPIFILRPFVAQVDSHRTQGTSYKPRKPECRKCMSTETRTGISCGRSGSEFPGTVPVPVPVPDHLPRAPIAQRPRLSTRVGDSRRRMSKRASDDVSRREHRTSRGALGTLRTDPAKMMVGGIRLMTRRGRWKKGVLKLSSTWHSTC